MIHYLHNIVHLCCSFVNLIVYICCLECQPWLLIVTGVMHEQTTLIQSATLGSVISKSGFSQ